MNICITVQRTLAVLTLVALGLAYSASAQALDWSSVPARDVPVFYTGQASWEWALTERDHSGAPKIREGKTCKACHEGEQADIGKKIVAAKKLEAKPVDKPASINLKVKTAHDGERLYVRIEWQEPKAAQKGKGDFATRVTLMLDDGHVKEAARGGCWAACHDDSMAMASAKTGDDIKKYLVTSRTKITRQGGGHNLKSAAEINQLLKQGDFLEYWQAKLNPGKAAVAADGYILETRHKHSPPSFNADADYQNGKWVVVLSRKLLVTDPGHKALQAGRTYTVGFAVHENFSEHRFHHVSFDYSLVLDQGKADFVAVKR